MGVWISSTGTEIWEETNLDKTDTFSAVHGSLCHQNRVKWNLEMLLSAVLHPSKLHKQSLAKLAMHKHFLFFSSPRVMRKITVAKLIFFSLLVLLQPEGSLRQRISQKEPRWCWRRKGEQWNFNGAVLSFSFPPKKSNYGTITSPLSAVFAYLWVWLQSTQFVCYMCKGQMYCWVYGNATIGTFLKAWIQSGYFKYHFNTIRSLLYILHPPIIDDELYNW